MKEDIGMEPSFFAKILRNLRDFEQQGIRFSMEGVPCTPEYIAATCFLFEEREYMREYMIDEGGIVKVINFVRTK